ncbi:hypothetical protein B296_00052916 [Ensete ventricosum]|uniref:Uncharacterized protein n=1 Tax=Ensete ventricosum TaxID=4639 RepID=A0A426X681_ENSVE|nr:hypothetical protein B296_00052916 [Ensete ventricosum]
MSPERPVADSGAERWTDSDRPWSAEEGPAAVPTPQPLLEDDDGPRVSLARVKSATSRCHSRGFPRPHQPSPGTCGDGADFNLVPASTDAFGGASTSASKSGITNSPKSRNRASRRGATGQGHQGAHTSGPDYTNVDTYSIAYPNSQSGTD